MSSAIHVIALITTCLSSVCTPKDCILCYKNRQRDIEHLPANIRTLYTRLTSIKSKKEEIDEQLSNSVRLEKNENYQQLKENISGIHNERTQLIEKYKMITGNQLSSTTEQADTSTDSLLIEEGNNWESSVIEEIRKPKWKRPTRKFMKLAKLSRVIAKLNKYASDILDRMYKDNYSRPKRKPDASNQEKLDVHKHHPVVFNNHVDELVKYLHEGKNVGIYGPPGVGKTWVMKLLFNRLIEDKSLLLIWTKYPPEDDTATRKLQEEIMEQLGIKHEATGNTDKDAKTISCFLDGKKCILLIDQVRKKIKLKELGVKQNNEYNVVIAGIDGKVISSKTDVTVQIQKLKKDDALKLFRDVFGENLDNRKTEIADRIVDCCDGIPWMIRHVANHLKGQKNEDSWNDVKQTLQSDSPGPNAICGRFEKVYELMYSGLDTDTKKQCLLYGALFPQRYPIPRDYLIECWTAEGFINIGNPFDKVKRSRCKGSGILDELTQKSLLYSSDEKNNIMMPTDFRRMALTPGYFEEKIGVYWVQRCEEEPPNTETWTKIIRMSWICCTTELPQSPKCFDIQTLLLQRKPNLQRLEDLFFNHMQSLKVLNLNHTEIGALPTSISNLVNLVSLYLKDCKKLESLPPQAASLVKLEFLDIQRTSIPRYPENFNSFIASRN